MVTPPYWRSSLFVYVVPFTTCRGELHLGHAIRLSERAISRADRIGSSVALASAYWNASVFQSARGMTAGALDLAKRALVLLTAHGDARNLTRLRSQVGAMHLEMDPPNLAEADVSLCRSTTSAQRTTTTATAIRCVAEDRRLPFGPLRSAALSTGHAYAGQSGAVC